MTQYINKNTLVAGINKLKEHFVNKRDGFERGYHNSLNAVSDYIDTLEVKEVDLDEHQIADIIQNLFPTDQFIESETLLLSRNEALKFAKHFFELGLKAAQKRE